MVRTSLSVCRTFIPILAVAGIISPARAAQGVANTVLVSNGLDVPVFVTHAPGDDRLFVLEQYTGRVRILKDGVLLPMPFLDLPAVTGFVNGFERGLLGMAFHPDFTANGYFFVSYSGAGGASRLDRFRVSSTDPDQADPSTQIPLLDIPQPFENHNGGCIEFGPDGFLYLGLGDGGDSGDPNCNAQNGQTLLGKLLRLDVDAIDATGSYAIPPDNPFVGDASVLDEIVHIGLRNPWRFCFDEKTGWLILADVGQTEREEINALDFTQRGSNFGWKIMEGSQCFFATNCAPSTPLCGSTAFSNPTFEYDHLTGCSITGGYVYRGSAIPALEGQYFYADYCSSNIWSLDPFASLPAPSDLTADLAPGGGLDIQSITSFGRDFRGELYLCEQWSGEVFSVVAPGAAAPVPALDARFERISIASGGFQGLTLDAGPARAGELYVILGSASGTVPGLLLDGLVLPLNFDAYLLSTLKNFNKGAYKRTLGFLDSDGRADALIRIPAHAVAGSAAGLVLNHAFAIVDPIFGTLEFASGAVPLELIP